MKFVKLIALIGTDYYPGSEVFNREGYRFTDAEWTALPEHRIKTRGQTVKGINEKESSKGDFRIIEYDDSADQLTNEHVLNIVEDFNKSTYVSDMQKDEHKIYTDFDCKPSNWGELSKESQLEYALYDVHQPFGGSIDLNQHIEVALGDMKDIFADLTEFRAMKSTLKLIGKYL